MEYQITDVIRALKGDDNEKKYYVYRFVDPCEQNRQRGSANPFLYKKNDE